MLISLGGLTLKVRSSRKQYVYKILKLIPSEGKGAKGEKRIRKARIKEQRQFLEKIAQKAKSLTAQSLVSPENARKQRQRQFED